MSRLSAEEQVLLLGAGKMGTALAGGWLKSRVLSATQLTIVEPHPSQALKALQTEYRDLRCEVALGERASPLPQIVVLAVKPQQMAEAVSGALSVFDQNTLFVSIAAGLSIQKLRDLLQNTKAKIVRTMPNTPSVIGAGVTAFVMADNVNDEEKSNVQALLNAVGVSIELSDERHMDAVTAISGSGPAYVFVFLEGLIEAGIELGLPADVATTLALQTVEGSGRLANCGASSPAELREQVTSPNGTTAAALDVLLKDNVLKDVLKRAALAAKTRSQELNINWG